MAVLNPRADVGESVRAPVEAAGKLVELGRYHFEPGYWQGLRQPAVLVPLKLTRLEVSAAAVRRYDDILGAAFSPRGVDLAGKVGTAVSTHPMLGRLLGMTLEVLVRIGMPVMGGAAAVKPDAQNPQRWIVGLPAIAEHIRAPQAAFAMACRLMNELALGRDVTLESVRTATKELATHFRPQAPAGINTLRFLHAAHELAIPWRHVANNVYQFGWGKRSRWLDSSFTDETSTISASLARDKVACAKVLRDAGLPVPRHQLVATAEQAVKVADAMGYPVVLKPANLDGGTGVMVGLRDADAVTHAFAVATKLSKRILVEQLVDGNDYRVRICNGEVIGVVIRKAASVTGDGVKSVRALIDDINTARAQPTKPSHPDVEQGSKPIIADEEVDQWLAAQGLDLDSVVPFGEQVRLRGAANVNLGGTSRDVTREAHPDNLALALHAAAALRLDVAGADLLLPDIARSWKETGGVVCEVNGQPQFSSGIAHRTVLERLVRGQGRIPVIGVMLPGLGAKPIEALVRELECEGVQVRVASTAQECLQALRCADVHAVIWKMDAPPLLFSGLPVDRLSLMIHQQGLTDLSHGPLLSDDWRSFDEPLDAGSVIKVLRDHLRENCLRRHDA